MSFSAKNANDTKAKGSKRPFEDRTNFSETSLDVAIKNEDEPSSNEKEKAGTKRYKPWRPRKEEGQENAEEIIPPRPEGPPVDIFDEAFLNTLPKRVRDWLLGNGKGKEKSSDMQNDMSIPDLRRLLAEQLAVFHLPVAQWITDEDMCRLPPPSEDLFVALGLCDPEQESTSAGPLPPSSSKKDPITSPENRNPHLDSQSLPTNVQILKPLVQQDLHGELIWTDSNGQHELSITMPTDQLHVAIARKLNPSCTAQRANTTSVTGLSHPYLTALLTSWIEQRPGKIVAGHLSRFLLGVLREHRPYFLTNEAYLKIESALLKRPKMVMYYNEKDCCLRVLRKDIGFCLHRATCFDHLNLPSIEELEDSLGHELVISGKVKEEDMQTLRNSSACRFLASYLVKVLAASEQGRLSQQDAERIKTEFQEERDLANRMFHKRQVAYKVLRHLGYTYDLIQLAGNSRSFSRNNKPSEPHPRALHMYWYIKDEVEKTDFPNYGAIWREANKQFSMPRLQEAIEITSKGQTIRDIPMAEAIKARIRRHGCPLPGLALVQDPFYCVYLGDPTSSLYTLSTHDRLQPHRAGKMGNRNHCLEHSVHSSARIFVDVYWATKMIKGFIDRIQDNLAPHMSPSELLHGSLPAQVGIHQHLVPLLAQSDAAGRDQLERYILRKGPAPNSRTEVGEHLLMRPTMALDMTKYLDPAWVRAKDMLRVLSQRLPSIDKLFNLRHDDKIGWYQHRLGNIRVSSQAYNSAKSGSFTPFVADLLEYAIFIHQTASRHIGESAAAAKLEAIEEILDAAYLANEAQVKTWRARPAETDDVEEHASMVMQKTLMETAPPLSASSVFNASAAEEEAGDDDREELVQEGEAPEDTILQPAWKSSETPPPGTLKRIRSFARELEARYGSQLCWVQNVPEPFGLGLEEDGLTQAEVLKAVWNEALRLETRRKTQCDQRRQFKAGPQPEFDIEDEQLRGLSSYSASNNSTFTMLVVALQSYLEGRIQRCHGTGLKLCSPTVRFLHPLRYSFAHAIHGLPMSHGFTYSPSSLADCKTLAQNFVFESNYFNFWRRGERRLIASLELNQGFGIAFAKQQKMDKRLSISDGDLAIIEKLNVRWRDDMDQRIHINAYNHTEQTLYHHLTRL